MPTHTTHSEELRPLIRRGVLIPGYAVGDGGTVYSYWHKAPGGRIRWVMGEDAEPLAAYPIGKNGAYLGVAFRHDGRTVRASVHTLVMEAFVGPCPDGQEVCHDDGNGHNNRLGNLRYDTRPSNHADKRRHGTHQDGERNQSAKLTNAQAEEIKRLRNVERVPLSVIAARFDVWESTVSRIANGVRRSR